MCWNLNLIKLQASRPAILLEMNSNIGVFCEIYETFKNTFFDESCGSFWKYLVKHRFVAYENDEWCHFIIRIGSLVLISIYCVGFVSFYLFLFSYICVDSFTCWGIKVNLSILKVKQWSCSWIPQWSFEECVASSLLSN